MPKPTYLFGRLREAVAVFDDEDTLTAAIEELESHGFDRSEISLIAGEQTLERTLGYRLRSVAQAEDDARVPRTAYISPESRGELEGAAISSLLFLGAVGAAGAVVASGGTVGALLFASAASGAAGASIGALIAQWIDRHHADYIEQQIERGGLVLWVRAWDPDQERRAVEVLKKHSGHDVHVHELKPRSPASAGS